MSRPHPLATQTGYGYQVSTVQPSVRDKVLGSRVSLPKRRQHPLEEAAWLDAESRHSVAAHFLQYVRLHRHLYSLVDIVVTTKSSLGRTCFRWKL